MTGGEEPERHLRCVGDAATITGDRFDEPLLV